MTQEQAIEAIKKMPPQFKVDELTQRLSVIEKIEEAESDFAEGRTIPNSDVQKLFDEWKK